MTTVRELIQDAVYLLGVVDPTESLNASFAAQGLRRLNAMLQTWSAESLMVYTQNREVFPLVVGQQDYTLGPGGNFNTTRPIWFDQASIIPTASAPTLEIPLKIDSDEDWQDVSIKSINSTFPLEVHPLGNFPLNTLQFWPIPTAACSVVLYLPQQLGAFTSVDDTVLLPPGYEEAIIYNLAARMAPMFGTATPPDVARVAISSKDTLKSQNMVPSILAVDSALCGNMTGPSLSAIKSKGYVVD